MKLHAHTDVSFIGNRYAMIIVESYAYTKKGRAHFNVKCDCGGTNISCGRDIKNGKIKSCGCKNPMHKKENMPLQEVSMIGKTSGSLTVLTIEKDNAYKVKCVCGFIDIIKADQFIESKNCEHEKISIQITTTGTLHSIWSNMKNRCSNPDVDSYEYYGARGISVCNEWKYNFNIFFDWAFKNGYKEGLSIERINVDGNYEPSNCKWIPLFDQAKNKRNTRYIEYNGIIKTIPEWAKILGVSSKNINYRLRAGWSAEEALTNSKNK